MNPAQLCPKLISIQMCKLIYLKPLPLYHNEGIIIIGLPGLTFPQPGIVGVDLWITFSHPNTSPSLYAQNQATYNETDQRFPVLSNLYFLSSSELNARSNQ